MFKIAVVVLVLLLVQPAAKSKQEKIAIASPVQLTGSVFHTYLPITNPPTNNDFTPIALPPGSKLSGVSLSGKACLKQIDGPGKSYFANQSVVWKARYKMYAGCALLNMNAPVLVDIGPVTAYINENTAMVMHIEDNVVRLVNLADHRRYSARVVLGKNYIDLEPGHELVFVHTSIADPKAIAIQEGIGWREMQHITSDGWHIFAYRVSAADMLKTCKIYRQLNQSPLPIDRDLRDTLVKTVAALEEMYNKRKGPYYLDPYLYGQQGVPSKLARSKAREV